MASITEQSEACAKEAAVRLPRVYERGDKTVTELPPDVRGWVDPCTLSFWVQDEVEPRRFGSTDREVARFQRETLRMFGVLAFAYTAGVLASEDIASSCKSDPALRFLSGGQVPFASEVAAFRRRHRLELERVLARILGRVLTSRNGNLSPETCIALLQDARDRLDIARHLDNCD